MDRTPYPHMRSLAPTICRILGIRLPSQCSAPPLAEVIEDMGKQHRLCLVVIDTFGTGLWQLHQQHTPHLNAMAENRSIVMQAEAPPYTPVNITTMATGAPFAVHGVRKRKDIIKGETILDVMTMCALKTGIAAREKSALYSLISQSITFKEVAKGNRDEEVHELAKKCLCRHKPDFFWIHYLDIDNAAHTYGPRSAECRQAIIKADRRIDELSALWREYYYSGIIVADHGQHQSTGQEGKMMGVHDGTQEDDFLVPLIWKASPSIP